MKKFKCNRCKKSKNETNFYKRKNGSLRNPCKECHSKYGKEWIALNIERMNFLRKRWIENNPKLMCEKSKRYRIKNPDKVKKTSERWRFKNSEKVKTHRAYWLAVKNKKIIPLDKCEVCGDRSPEAHHEDYKKPLDVIYLCAFCHSGRHLQLKKEGNKNGWKIINE